MMRLITISTTLVVICSFLPPSLANQPLLPPIDAELIITGLKHSESLLKSGTGRFKFYGSAYFAEKKKNLKIDEGKINKGTDGGIQSKTVLIEELLFAFSGEHSYFKFLGMGSGEIIFDGKIQLTIPHSKQILMRYGYFNPSDPRGWGPWYKKQKLSDYLGQQEKIRVVGGENLDGIPCYIVETQDPKLQDAVVKFWIAPRNGFRCVQTLYETGTRRQLRKIEWQGYQLKGQENEFVWFPKHGISLSMKRSNPKEPWSKPFRNEAVITDFQPNIDVSHFFHLQIPPETKIFNVELKQSTTFKEIGWQEINKQ